MAQTQPAPGSSAPAAAGQDATSQALKIAAEVQKMPAKHALSPAQARFLRGQAHERKALLQVGDKGITQALVAELDGALEHHELVKVRLAAEDRDARDAMIVELAKRTRAALVQRIGHVAVLYRPGKDKRRIVLPKR